MKLLVLGGTQFVGRAMVSEALARGYDVSLFNRGRTNADLFPDVEKLVGDRDGGLDPLRGRSWDAVLDVNGYVPRLVGDSARLLADAAGHYTFVSTISVYADNSVIGANEETTALGTMEDETVEEITGESYGPLKVLCEQVVAETFPGRSTIIRPGLIVGPHDHTNRFGYWPTRLARGGDILIPGQPERVVQFIDARDLAIFTLDMTEKKATGAYNATGPIDPLPMRTLVDTTLSLTSSEAQIHWVDEQFLLDNEVQPWNEIPFWVPDVDPSFAGFMRVDCRKAQAAGLTYRPLSDTVRDTLAWEHSRTGFEWDMRLSPEKEMDLIQKWLNHN